MAHAQCLGRARLPQSHSRLTVGLWRRAEVLSAPTAPWRQRRRTGAGPTRSPACSPRGPSAASGRSHSLIARHRLVASNDEGRTGGPGGSPPAAGPSARAAVPSFCEGDAGRTRAWSGRGASGEDAALASAFGLRLTQAVEESACRAGGPERHDRVLFLTGLAEPQRAERRRRRRRPRRLPSRTPCTRTMAWAAQNAQGGQDAACRRPPPHGAAASRHSGHLGHPPVIAGRRRVQGNRAAHSPHGRRRHGARAFEAACREDGCGRPGWQRGGACAGRTLLLRVTIAPDPLAYGIAPWHRVCGVVGSGGEDAREHRATVMHQLVASASGCRRLKPPARSCRPCGTELWGTRVSCRPCGTAPEAMVGLSARGARAPWRQAPRPIGPMGPIGPIGPTGRDGGPQHPTDDRIHRATPRPRPIGPIGPIGPGAAPFRQLCRTPARLHYATRCGRGVSAPRLTPERQRDPRHRASAHRNAAPKARGNTGGSERAGIRHGGPRLRPAVPAGLRPRRWWASAGVAGARPKTSEEGAPRSGVRLDAPRQP